mmetsp:Transcript_129425/g.360500  ORF Transcript_129425/g.360500 Transcript_129425/m.360500 type:complete len:331 (+) Transcript_129425:480-1472(+)
MLPPAPSMRTSRPAFLNSSRWAPPPTNSAWWSSVITRTRTPRDLASFIAAFISGKVSVNMATSSVACAPPTSATSVLKFASPSSGKKSTVVLPLQEPQGASPTSALAPGAKAVQRRANSAEKAVAMLGRRLTTMFSRLFLRAPVVQLREPVTQTAPSTTTNLWCMCSLLLSRRTWTPASRSLCKSEVSNACSASLSASTLTWTPALCRPRMTSVRWSSVSMKTATSRLLDAPCRTSTSKSRQTLPEPGFTKAAVNWPRLLLLTHRKRSNGLPPGRLVGSRGAAPGEPRESLWSRNILASSSTAYAAMMCSRVLRSVSVTPGPSMADLQST